MGPFALVPFMECRHSVWSMQHSVCGTLKKMEKHILLITARDTGKVTVEGHFPKDIYGLNAVFHRGL